MNCSVTSDHIIAEEEVGTVDCEDELRPAVRTSGLESDVEREVPDDPGGRVEAPAADLTDPLLLASSDHPVLAPDPEQTTVEVIMVREPGLLHLASDRDKEVTTGTGQHYLWKLFDGHQCVVALYLALVFYLVTVLYTTHCL